MDKVNTNFFNIKSVLEEYGDTSDRRKKQKSSSSLIPILEQTKQTESKILGKTQKDFQKNQICDPYAYIPGLMINDQKKNRNQKNVLVTGKMNTTNPTFFPSFDSIGKG